MKFIVTSVTLVTPSRFSDRWLMSNYTPRQWSNASATPLLSTSPNMPIALAENLASVSHRSVFNTQLFYWRKAWALNTSKPRLRALPSIFGTKPEAARYLLRHPRNKIPAWIIQYIKNVSLKAVLVRCRKKIARNCIAFIGWLDGSAKFTRMALAPFANFR